MENIHFNQKTQQLHRLAAKSRGPTDVSGNLLSCVCINTLVFWHDKTDGKFGLKGSNDARLSALSPADDYMVSGNYWQALQVMDNVFRTYDFVFLRDY